jgi:phosphoglycerate dehydrogenase-like enzyme
MRRAVLNMRDERPVWAPPADLADRLRARLGTGWELVEVEAPVSGRGDGSGTSAEAIEAMRGAEIFFGLGLSRDLLLAGLDAGRLRWVHTGAAGVASLLHPELRTSGIILTNSAGIHAEPIAETVMAMLLHFARGLDHTVRAQHRRTWDASPFESGDGIRELAGATLGIVGYGGIGRAVARRATALGMHVLATRRRAQEDEDGVEMLSGADALSGLLERSDVVVLSVPATEETRSLIDADALARMKRDAILINVARGSVVDEEALVAMLRERRLRGAALDVFAAEPLPEDSPLWTLDNVLITPHVSATSPRFWEREGALMLDNVGRYLSGATLRNVVDVTAGY